jgi:hypothetical protein
LAAWAKRSWDFGPEEKRKYQKALYLISLAVCSLVTAVDTAERPGVICRERDFPVNHQHRCDNFHGYSPLIIQWMKAPNLGKAGRVVMEVRNDSWKKQEKRLGHRDHSQLRLHLVSGTRRPEVRDWERSK